MTNTEVDVMTDEEIDRTTLYWFTLTNILKFNKLAKAAKTLGDKAYFRLLREEANKKFVELGGNDDVFKIEDAIVEIKVPGDVRSTIVFRPQDIELMRDAVHEYDVSRR